MGKKGDLSDFERGMVVGDRRIWVFHNLLSYWDFHAQTFLGFTKNDVKMGKTSSMWQSCGQKCLIDARGQRRMGRLTQADRRATLTEITTRYNRGMQQKHLWSHNHTTLRQMSYNSRRPHWAPLISTTKKKRLQFARAHQNFQSDSWRLEKCCLVEPDKCVWYDRGQSLSHILKK